MSATADLVYSGGSGVAGYVYETGGAPPPPPPPPPPPTAYTGGLPFFILLRGVTPT